MLSYGLSPDYRDKQSEIIKSVDSETLNKLANKWLDPDSMDIIVVGQAQTLRDELKVFEREIIEIEVPQ
jgi:zinc protease